MIYINTFSISDDGLSIYVDVETDAGSTFNSAKLWSDATFKNNSQAIDLTSSLSQTGNRETFTVTASSLNLTSFFDVIYFIEFEVTDGASISNCNNCNNTIGTAHNLLSIKQCLLNKVLALDICSSCNDSCSCVKQCDIINIDNYLTGIDTALQYGLYNEAIVLVKSVRKLCPTCSDCIDAAISANTGLNYSIYLEGDD